jgi:phage regulator Rha-like protein
MGQIEISTINETLVVDSRLIAEELGIQHKNLLETIKKYLDRIERKEPVIFKTQMVKRPQGDTYEVIYCYLNEYQATLLMTLSRNTEKVLNCKEKLVDAFMKAKQMIPEQQKVIQELSLRLALANAEKELAIALATALPEPTQ